MSQFINLLNFIIPAVVLFPITIKGWASGILIVSSIISIIIIYKNRIKIIEIIDDSTKFNNLLILALCSFFLPFIVCLLTDTIKGVWLPRNYDAPLRYLLSIIIFIYISHYGWNVENRLKLMFGLSSIFTLFIIPFFPATGWVSLHSHRLSSPFIDPLIFGQLSLLLGVVSILSIDMFNKKNLQNIILMLGGLIGIYLSIKTDSRTGWLAVPFVLAFNIFQLLEQRLSKSISALMALLLSLIIVLVLYNFTGNVKQRINTAIYEVKNYQWNILSPTNGFNERVGFVRIGYHLFTLRPLTGWQNFDISIHQDDPEIANFVSVETRHGVKVSGFHNQFIDDMVKYGIFGLFSSLSVFLLPLLFFLYCYIKNIKKRLANIGIAIIFIQMISCLSHHVMSFKFVSSFYAMLIMILIGLIALHVWGRRL